MKQFISVSANHKQIESIIEKAKSLKSQVKDEISWDDGFKYSDKSSRNIKVFNYSEALWKHLLDLEPAVVIEPAKVKRVTEGSIALPSPSDVVKHGYKEPK